MKQSTQALLVFSVLMVPMMVAQAAGDNDDEHGVLHVHGTLTESTCRLDMTSAYQDVWLGNTGTGMLEHVGDRGTPVTVELKLRECFLGFVRSSDIQTDTVSWSVHPPAVSVSIVAPADEHSPELIKVSGAQGMGIRVMDALHHNIRLGSRSAPLFIVPGEDTLTYYVMPERTTVALEAGDYQANMDFRLSYD